MTNKRLYEKIFRIMGDLTPLYVDCGQLCNGTCCKGDNNTGMRLFPFEQSGFPIKDNNLVVCNGTCNRNKRPLACRIFPFFPAIDKKGKIYVEFDYRGARLCPILEFYDHLEFNLNFLKAVKKVGKLLVKNEECKKFLIASTEEIDSYKTFLKE